MMSDFFQLLTDLERIELAEQERFRLITMAEKIESEIATRGGPLLNGDTLQDAGSCRVGADAKTIEIRMLSAFIADARKQPRKRMPGTRN
jgi:hypothetical protein